MVLHVLGAVAQWEREAIGERTRDALAAKTAKGYRMGNLAYGYQADSSGKLSPHPGERETIATAKRLRKRGLSLRKLAAELNARDYRTRRAGK